MKLSDRLETVLSFVAPVKAAADIGTDHGHVPVELVRRGIAARAYAMDVRKGPLSRASENIRSAGLEERIETRLSDGAEKLRAGEVGAVIIAGMGGELIIHILEQGRHLWDTVDQWVLSPHSEIGKVREWLHENGFPIKREAMVFEEGKYYTVLDVGKKSQASKLPKPETFVYGEYLIRERDPVFAEYLKEEERKLVALADNLRKQAETSARATESLRETEAKLRKNQEVQNEMQGNY